MRINAKTEYIKESADVLFWRYAENQMIAIELVATGDFPEPLCRATFNPDMPISEIHPVFDIHTHVCIKTWSENAGVYETLVENNVIAPILGNDGKPYEIQAGFVKGKLARLTDSALQCLREQEEA